MLSSLIIIGAIPTTASSTIAEYNCDPNIGVCAVNALKKQNGSLKRLCSKFESNFRDIAGARKEVNMIDSDDIFESMSHHSLSERADQFIDRIILIVEICPDQVDVFLCILADKGNITFIRVDERIAQSCKLSIIIYFNIKMCFYS